MVRTSIALALVLILAAGCAATRPMGSHGDPGFLLGIWHGLISPITFVISLFSDHVRMYAYPNIGRWYDFGFLLGLTAWGGGGGVAASRR